MYIYFRIVAQQDNPIYSNTIRANEYIAMIEQLKAVMNFGAPVDVVEPKSWVNPLYASYQYSENLILQVYSGQLKALNPTTLRIHAIKHLVDTDKYTITTPAQITQLKSILDTFFNTYQPQ